MDTLDLKQKLLFTNLFIDNDQLSQYIDLVTSSQVVHGYTESHHILPRSFYKHNKLPVDDSVDNVVILSYADHCKAHWLLYYCTVGYLKAANATAVSYIVKRYKHITKKSVDANIALDEKVFYTLQSYMDSIMQDPDSTYYSKEAILFLKENYVSHGATYCAEKLNKTPAAVSVKAQRLKLAKTLDQKVWSKPELDTLKQYFKLEGSSVSKRLPGRSGDACRIKASELGLTRLWSDEEIQLLIQYFPVEGTSVYKRFPNRTKEACRRMAYDLGLSRDRKWTAAEITLLKELYLDKHLSAKALMEYFPGRTLCSIRGILQASDIRRCKIGKSK